MLNWIVWNHHHHHHEVRLARISLTLSLHVFLSFIAFGRSSGLHTVLSHSCCINVRAGRPAFDWPYAGVYRSTSLTISSLLLQQCPACLVRLACIVFGIGGRWPYSWRRVGCCRHGIKIDLALNNPQKLICQKNKKQKNKQKKFFSNRLVSVQVVHPYSSIDTTAAWKKLRFILSVRFDFHMIESLSIAVHAFVSRVSMSFSVDETLLPR